MKLDNIISMDEGTLGGQVVFKGTRVPVETLFDHLETSFSLDVFLEDFPSVTTEQAIALLDCASKLFNSKNIAQLYEAVA